MPLQWSHRLSAMETRRIPAARSGPGRCFNGATAFRRWKHGHRRADRPPRDFASMEPPPFGDGNCGPKPVLCDFRPALQWSHRLSAMETSGSLSGRYGAFQLQWSHRLSAMETMPARRKPNRPSRASMEPPPFGDGNTLTMIWRSEGKRKASMEPPPFGDGNDVPMPGTPPCQPSFNGATAFRRWKPDLVPAPDAIIWEASMEPPPFGDGNVVMDLDCVADATSFNGATAFRRWKHGGLQLHPPDPDPASMEPPPFGDGNLDAVHRGHVDAHVASMEPPPFGDGNPVNEDAPPRSRPTLQWSHRLSAMETRSMRWRG